MKVVDLLVSGDFKRIVLNPKDADDGTNDMIKKELNDRGIAYQILHDDEMDEDYIKLV